jgi:EamA domain-containing membrane protein RarD
VNQSRPSAEGVAAKPQHIFNLCVEFSEYNVNRNHISIPAVNAWGVDQIILAPFSLFVPISDDLVSDEPPKVFQKVWTRYVGYFVPNEAFFPIINLNVFHSLAVKMHLVTEVLD